MEWLEITQQLRSSGCAICTQRRSNHQRYGTAAVHQHLSQQYITCVWITVHENLFINKDQTSKWSRVRRSLKPSPRFTLMQLHSIYVLCPVLRAGVQSRFALDIGARRLFPGGGLCFGFGGGGPFGFGLQWREAEQLTEAVTLMKSFKLVDERCGTVAFKALITAHKTWTQNLQTLRKICLVNLVSTCICFIHLFIYSLINAYFPYKSFICSWSI